MHECADIPYVHVCITVNSVAKLLVIEEHATECILSPPIGGLTFVGSAMQKELRSHPCVCIH